MPAPTKKTIKKGELLFNEGDPSKAMYFVQSGNIRLFKRKGTSSVELGIIHKGEVIGEMGFLDGGARSASAEALHDTELTEITGTSLVDQMKVLPPWLMVLLKTIVNRLRSANNKIRQLETSSTAYTYGDEGVSKTYQFLSSYDVLKICMSVLLVASRNGEQTDDGMVKCTFDRIERYANQILGIHTSKITEMLDVLEKVGLARVVQLTPEKAEVFLPELGQLDYMINFINDENVKDHAKKMNFSVKAVVIMSYMVKHLDSFTESADGFTDVNLAQIIATEKETNGGKDPFRIDDIFQELVKSKIATETSMKDNDTVITRINAKIFVRVYRVQRVLKEVEALNEKKRTQTSRR